MVLLLAIFSSLTWALKFDIAAHQHHSNRYERCIRNFVGRDTLVVVTAISDGHEGDGQLLNMRVSIQSTLGFGVANESPFRSWTQRAMNTDGRRTLLVKSEWHLPHIQMQRLTSASRML